jgi:hypothetical protein
LLTSRSVSRSKSTDTTNDLRIAAFPNDANYWRIDWFGEIHYPDRSLRGTQPSVLVYLSRVTDPSFIDNPSVLLSPHSTTLAKIQMRRWVSVGTLVLLKVGDIWHKKSLFLSPNYELETFSGVSTSSSHIDLIKSGLNLNEEGFLIPVSEHPWHLNATHSYCVMLKLENGKRLIVPCLEVIRFYFGSSSSLLTKLFLPPLQKDSLFQDGKFDQKTRHLSIKLGDGIAGSSAATIGRIFLDKLAWRAAVIVGSSILKASQENHPIHPMGVFPFDGSTELQASGKWLSFGETSDATFLVYKLISCCHQFPFRSIKYEMSGEHKKPFFDQPQSDGTGQTSFQGSAPDAANQRIKEEDGSTKLQSKTRNFTGNVAFPDLIRKPIWKSKTLTFQQWLDKKRYVGGKSLDSTSLGTPRGNRRVRPIDLAMQVQRKNKNEMLPPEFIREFLEELLAVTGIDITLLTEGEDDGWSIPVPLITNEDGEVEPKLFIVDPIKNNRLRRLCVLSLRDNKDHHLMGILEGNPNFSKLYPTINTDDRNLLLVLKLTAEDFLETSQ